MHCDKSFTEVDLDLGDLSLQPEVGTMYKRPRTLWY
jgi:hypothetical protein